MRLKTAIFRIKILVGLLDKKGFAQFAAIKTKKKIAWKNSKSQQIFLIMWRQTLNKYKIPLAHFVEVCHPRNRCVQRVAYS